MLQAANLGFPSAPSKQPLSNLLHLWNWLVQRGTTILKRVIWNSSNNHFILNSSVIPGGQLQVLARGRSIAYPACISTEKSHQVISLCGLGTWKSKGWTFYQNEDWGCEGMINTNGVQCFGLKQASCLCFGLLATYGADIAHVPSPWSCKPEVSWNAPPFLPGETSWYWKAWKWEE